MRLGRERTVSSKKNASNRRNAKASTGPRDTSSTRFNAMRHGLASVQLTQFDSEMYAPTLQDFRAELQPVGEIEDLLVQRIALYATRLHRAASLTADYLTEATKSEIIDTRIRSTPLDHFALAATGEVTDSSRRLSDLKTSLQSLPAAIQALTEGHGASELVSALDGFSRAVEALPTARSKACDPLKIVETLEGRFQRYETQIENRMLRLLNELERIQRLRAGEAIPAPVNVNVALTACNSAADGGDSAQ